MKLSKKGEYALKAVIHLSFNYDKAPVQIQEISKSEKIPEKFLEQILLELKKGGILVSKRGSGGGYALNKPPDKITLAEVIRIIDGPLAPTSCVSEWAHVSCPEERTCSLNGIMLDVRNAITKVLEAITFSDACKRQRGLGAKGGMYYI